MHENYIYRTVVSVHHYMCLPNYDDFIEPPKCEKGPLHAFINSYIHDRIHFNSDLLFIIPYSLTQHGFLYNVFLA